MRHLLVSLASVSILGAMSGCQQPSLAPPARHWPVQASQSRRSAGPAMLFDRLPPALPAAVFAVRSDWPSAAGRIEGPEASYYREWYVDHFGRRGDGWNELYRLFEIYRVGARYK